MLESVELENINQPEDTVAETVVLPAPLHPPFPPPPPERKQNNHTDARKICLSKKCFKYNRTARLGDETAATVKFRISLFADYCQAGLKIAQMGGKGS